MKISSFYEDSINLDNIELLYFIPSPIILTQHSYNLDEVYSYYIKDNDNIYNINNWPFVYNKYKNIIKIDIDRKSYDIDENVFLLKYEVKNVGHTFLNLLLQIDYYFKNNLNCKIVIPIELLKINTFIGSFIYLFFTKSDLIIINSQYIYKIKKLYIDLNSGYSDLVQQNIDIYNSKIKDINEIMDISCINFFDEELMYKTDHIKQLLHDKIKLNLETYNFEKNIYKKICLIKNIENINETHININNTIANSFNKSYIDFFKENGFYIINPTILNILDLTILLNGCELLVTSWGCISYMNKMLINNENIKTLIISHIKYTHEFKFIPICSFLHPCKKVKLIYNLKSELDETSKKIIENAIYDFE